MAKFGKNVYGMMGYMVRVAPGHYELKWLGDRVEVKKISGATRSAIHWWVFVNGYPKARAKSLNEAMNWVANVWGNEPVMTHNMLNREAGEFPIARKEKGGCCDPATERYHCM